jgi:hypothetical protein
MSYENRVDDGIVQEIITNPRSVFSNRFEPGTGWMAWKI